MTDERIDKLLSRQRDRAIAVILGFKEREVDRHLSPEVSRRLRKTVLDELNELTAFAIDIAMKEQQSGSPVVNELFLQRLNEIHEVIVPQ